MTPARITYHAMNIVVCIVICVGLIALRDKQHADWLMAAVFLTVAFNGIVSLYTLYRDKP